MATKKYWRTMATELRGQAKDLRAQLANGSKPWIVCICGSTRFKEQFEKTNAEETLAGHIVLTVGMFQHADSIELTKEQKELLDELHLRKIDMANHVIVLNVGGYIGESTRNEIKYAWKKGKSLSYLEAVEGVGARRPLSDR